MPEAWEFPVKLGAALLKHYAAKLVGDEAIKLVADQALDAGKDGAIAGIDKWLKGAKARKEVAAALAQAAVQFAETESGKLLTAAGYRWSDTAAVNDAVERLAKSADETELRAAIAAAFRSDLPRTYSQAESDAAADAFLRCLRQSLLPLKDAGPAVVHQAVLRMEDELAALSRTARDVQELLHRTEQSLSRFSMQWQAQAEAELQQAFIDYTDYIADKSASFVGRRHVFDSLDRFLQTQPCGYFVIRGDPGIGKSALMAQLVKERQYAHHFNIAAAGISTSRQFFLNACAQMIARYKLASMSLPADAGQDGNFFARVLLAAARQSPQVVLAVDALDEVSDEGRPRRANPLLLPASLPPGVFIVVTTRRTDKEVELQVENGEVFELDADSESNLRDISDYVERFAKRAAMVDLLAEWQVPEKEFVSALRDKSEGNFMYLHHVLPAIEQRRYIHISLDDLPRGLLGYYQSHWEKMRGEDAVMFVRVNQKVIACLAVAHRPVTLGFVAKVTRLPLAQVQWTAEKWREFLHHSPGDGGTGYRIYHASYRDFLAAQIAG